MKEEIRIFEFQTQCGPHIFTACAVRENVETRFVGNAPEGLPDGCYTDNHGYYVEVIDGLAYEGAHQ